MKTVGKIVLAGVILMILAFGGCAVLVSSVSDPNEKPAVEKPKELEEPTVAEPEATEEPSEPALSPGQENALRSAEEYISMSGFSRSGLIEQLEYEGYPKKDAAFAVDNLDVSWKEQAVRSAEEYLSMSGFSRSGLIEQLMYEGYTRAQASYGADQAGL